MLVPSNDDDLFEAVRFTNTDVRLVGQAPAPSKCVLLSTSLVVRRLTRDWVLSDAGNKWTIKLDRTLRVSGELLLLLVCLLAAVLVVMALPLDFFGELRILRTKFLLGALHEIEGSAISCSLLQRLRFAFVQLSGLKGCLGSCWCSLVPVGWATWF